MRKVVVTGIGALSPLGNSFLESWDSARSGTSGLGHITRFDASGIKWKIAGELKGFKPDKYFLAKELAHLDLFVQYGVAASIMAAEDAGLVHKPASKHQSIKASKTLTLGRSDTCNVSSLEHAGIIIGSSRGGIGTIENSLTRSIRSNSLRLSPYLMPSTSVNAAASYVARRLGIRGHCLGISNACASGANAIGEAYRLIRAGHTDLVFAGGSEAPICRLCIEGYGVTGALSKISDSSASRPFDSMRNGFVLSEGACVLVIEDCDKALKRNAKIYGELVGYGNTSDAFHQTRPDAKGEAKAISMALEEAGIKTDEIDYISVHAPSTAMGDKAEADAINIVFGKKAGEIPVSSLKSMTGHMLSASGALEAAVTLMSLEQGIIIPTINLRSKDPECRLNVVTETINAGIKTAISNSFGFGGVNAVLVFRKLELEKHKGAGCFK